MSKKLEKRPAFQFYPKDLLSDTETMAMPNEVMGMYFKLLCFDWINDGVPDNDATILKVTNFEYMNEDAALRDPEDYGKAIALLRNKLMPHPLKEGYLTNPRLQKEREKQDERAKERSVSGKKGADSRWKKPKKRGIAKPSSKNGSATQQPMAKNGSSSSSSSSTSTKLLSKDSKGQSPTSYGNEEINKMLIALKTKIGIEDFADAQKWARIYAKNCLRLVDKIGPKEFSKRLEAILDDSFKRKNCNKIRYVYEQIKGFMPEAEDDKIIV